MSTACPSIPVKRLIDRRNTFHQSSDKVNIRIVEHFNDKRVRWARRILFAGDWFDYIVTKPTCTVVTVLISIYSTCLLIWAGFYMAVDFCLEGEENLTFQEAFAFSLETATTVGFGLVREDMFFNGCGQWIAIVYFQCMFFLLFNGLVLGTIMYRLQRANRRAKQIVFSNKACIICLRGKFYLTLQVYDLQAGMPVIDSSVRLYAVFRETGEGSPVNFQTRVMRITRPDDEIGSKLWLSVPCTILHEIDVFSPLAPRVLAQQPKVAYSSAPTRFPNPPRRAMDGRAGSNMYTTCYACGESFGTEAALRRHLEFKMEEEEDALAKAGDSKGGGGAAHLDTQAYAKDISRPVISRQKPGEEITNPWFETVSAEYVRDEIRKRIVERKIEIIMLVEGTDPRTSNPTQARQSYMEEDIEFDAQHASCMQTRPNGGAVVNLSKFHDVIRYDYVNVESAYPFASHS